MKNLKLDVLHVRDPDGDCSVRVWINGEEVEGLSLVDVDAGRGYEIDDWRENYEWADRELVGSFRDAVLEAYGDPPGSKYIDGWDSDGPGLTGAQALAEQNALDHPIGAPSPPKEQ